MSGGHYQYEQFRLNDIAESMKNDIHRLEYKIGESIDSESIDYTPEEYFIDWLEPYEKDIIISKMKETILALEKTYNMVHRIDWFMSGDDGIESFQERWVEDVLGFKTTK